jgi:hypothetical protein
MREAVVAAGGQRDYYAIYLPGGAENLPTMVLAGKIVFSDPAAFGYRADKNRQWRVYSGIRATVDSPTTARELAKQFKMDYKSFRDLNPHLISGEVPAGISINLP